MQVALLGALMATLVYFPAGLALASLLALFGLPLERVLTFDGAFSAFIGAFAWWLLAFGAACVHARFAFPWDEKVLAWPRKK